MGISLKLEQVQVVRIREFRIPYRASGLCLHSHKAEPHEARQLGILVLCVLVHR